VTNGQALEEVRMQLAAHQAMMMSPPTQAKTAAQTLQGTPPKEHAATEGGRAQKGSVIYSSCLPFFPAARYSVSLDSLRNSQGEDVSIAGVGRRTGDQAVAYIQQLQLNVQNLPRVRALVSAGGHFESAAAGMKTAADSYCGGAVRLMNLPEGCSFIELVAVLAKTELSGPRASRSGGSRSEDGAKGMDGGRHGSSAVRVLSAMLASHASDGGKASISPSVEYILPKFCTVRYQLPTDPSVLVDILDDEDVKLMFEENAELRTAQGWQ